MTATTGAIPGDPFDELAGIAANARALRARLGELEVTVTSQRRLLTATVGHDGKLKDIAFSDERYRALAPVELSAIIVETAQEAARQAADQALKAVDDAFPRRFAVRGDLAGDDRATYGAMLDRLGELGISPDLLREMRSTLEDSGG